MRSRGSGGLGVPQNVRRGRLDEPDSGFWKPWFTTNALLDSGATISLFDGAVARILGISIGKGKRIRPVGIGGAIRAYTHTLTLKIGDEEFEGEVAFSYERGIPINLLGRTSVFKRFLVTLDERNQRTILGTA